MQLSVAGIPSGIPMMESEGNSTVEAFVFVRHLNKLRDYQINRADHTIRRVLFGEFDSDLSRGHDMFGGISDPSTCV